VKQWFKIGRGPIQLADIFLRGDEVKLVRVIATAQSDGGDNWLMKQW